MPMDLKGKTILVTGSTDGVGRLVALRLAANGAQVLVHGRNAQRGQQVVEEIRRSGKGSAALYVADLSSMAEVRRLGAEVLAKHPRVDVLINNAGIGTVGTGAGKREQSPDGHELRFAVNYLSGFLLTHLLLDRLLGSTPARIVNVSSLGQQALDFGDVMLTRGYSGQRAYCQSKLAQILFTIDLAEQLKGCGILANSVHPATYMATTMVRQAGISPISTVEEGADAILQLAVSPKIEGVSGQFFNGMAQSRANAQAYDAKARRTLRELSLKLVGLPADAA
jgi:NAD(P)-dependent dehydrogenase (short-subunit alcohol dehydrogenase family)